MQWRDLACFDAAQYSIAESCSCGTDVAIPENSQTVRPTPTFWRESCRRR